MSENVNNPVRSQSNPKIAAGAIAAWVIALTIMIPGMWGEFQGADKALFVTMIPAMIPILIGGAIQLSMKMSAKETELIADDRSLFCKSKNTRSVSGQQAYMEIPYESIMNIRVTPEALSNVNGDIVTIYLPGNVLTLHYITNAPEIVMAIRSKVEEKKGPMPPYGYPMPGIPMYGQPMLGQPAYGQPMYRQPPYGQPMYAQPAYGQPMYGQPAYGQPPYGQPMYWNNNAHELRPAQPNYAAPPHSQYQPVRSEDQYPTQTVYPDMGPEPEMTETAYRPEKDRQEFIMPEAEKPQESFDDTFGGSGE